MSIPLRLGRTACNSMIHIQHVVCMEVQDFHQERHMESHDRSMMDQTSMFIPGKRDTSLYGPMAVPVSSTFTVSDPGGWFTCQAGMENC